MAPFTVCLLVFIRWPKEIWRFIGHFWFKFYPAGFHLIAASDRQWSSPIHHLFRFHKFSLSVGEQKPVIAYVTQWRQPLPPVWTSSCSNPHLIILFYPGLAWIDGDRFTSWVVHVWRYVSQDCSGICPHVAVTSPLLSYLLERMHGGCKPLICWMTRRASGSVQDVCHGGKKGNFLRMKIICHSLSIAWTSIDTDCQSFTRPIARNVWGENPLKILWFWFIFVEVTG